MSTCQHEFNNQRMFLCCPTQKINLVKINSVYSTLWPEAQLPGSKPTDVPDRQVRRHGGGGGGGGGGNCPPPPPQWFSIFRFFCFSAQRSVMYKFATTFFRSQNGVGVPLPAERLFRGWRRRRPQYRGTSPPLTKHPFTKTWTHTHKHTQAHTARWKANERMLHTTLIEKSINALSIYLSKLVGIFTCCAQNIHVYHCWIKCTSIFTKHDLF